MNRLICLMLTVAIGLLARDVSAAPPTTLNYQGALTNTSGTPVSGTLSMTLRLYAAATGGVPLYAETQSVAVSNGNFNVQLGAVSPLSLPFDVPYFLGVTVGTDAEMTPRQPLASSGYAFRASSADTISTGAVIPAGQISGSLANATIPAANVIGGVSGSGTVTSVATGTGLTGGPITSSGTINLAATNRLPTTACATNQIPQWSGVAWVCATPTSLPSGGAPGESLVGSATGATWSTTLAPTGNLQLESSTASAGNIVKFGTRFLHDFGDFNLFLGSASGNFTLAGGFNTGIGSGALVRTSSGSTNTALGYNALSFVNTGFGNIGIGYGGGAALTTGDNNVAIGHTGVAGESATTRIGTAQTRAFVAGIYGTAPSGSVPRPVVIDENGQLGTASLTGSGTVTSVTTGPGLTGGPVITTGTIGLAATNLLPTTPCFNGQSVIWDLQFGTGWRCRDVGTLRGVDASNGSGLVSLEYSNGRVDLFLDNLNLLPRPACNVNESIRWSGSQWQCAVVASGTGSVTSVATGAGLSGGPISATGTINLTATNLLPTTACAANQIPKWSGTGWACAADDAGAGSLTSIATGAGLTGGPITSSGTINLAATNLLPITSCGTGEIAKWNGTQWQCASDNAGAGTVTSVVTGVGLSGGPITSSGTVSLAATNLLPTVACAANQIPKWNGAAWACAADANGGGTVTSVATGAGLTGGPIIGGGTVNLAATNLLPTTACAVNQIAKWNGTAWICAADLDSNSGGTVTSVAAGAGLTGGPITSAGTLGLASTNLLPTTACATNQIVKWTGTAWSCAADDTGSGDITEVTVGAGLNGGATTGVATINLAATNLLPTAACAANQIAKWNGSAWACAADAIGAGTVASVSAGTGLTGGTITSTGTIGLSTTNLLPTTACGTTQIPKWNGAAWACAADNAGTGTVTSIATGAGLSGGPITGTGTLNLAATNLLPTTACAANQVAKWNGSAWACAAIIEVPPAGVAGQLLAGSAGGPTWTASPSISGNLVLGASTAIAGNVVKAGSPFLHNFGSGNVFLGLSAGNFTMTGIRNVGIGASALVNVSTGSENMALGSLTLTGNSTGSFNVAIGTQSLLSNSVGNDNTAIGYNTLGSNSSGNQNLAVGSNALSSNTASGNTAIGFNSLLNNSIGAGLTAAGQSSLTSNTTGNSNAAFGASAMRDNTTGNNNSALGEAALLLNQTGNFSTAIGSGALRSSNGSSNTAVGTDALRNHATGTFNTAVGTAALDALTAGGSNVAIGSAALGGLATGNSNIGIGVSSGVNITTGSNNIMIGNAGVAADTNHIRIGTFATHARVFFAGIRGVTTAGPAINVGIDLSGQLGTTSSSMRYKEDIADMADASAVLERLRPVSFRYKSHQGGPLQYGLIAEEVAAIAPELVARNADGEIETVYYQHLPPMLLNEWQKQQRTIDAQAAQIETLQRDVALLKQLVLRSMR